jgi:hypothetical protein
MNKTITIDYIEYEKLINNREEFNKDKKRLQKEIVFLESELNFIKNSGEDILVIIKDNDNIIKYEFKEKEKKSMADIIGNTNIFLNKIDNLSNELNNLKEKYNNLKEEFNELSTNNELIRKENKRYKQIKFIKNLYFKLK